MRCKEMSREALQRDPALIPENMVKIEQNRPFRAEVPEGYEVRPGGWHADLLPLMAFGAHHRFNGRTLTPLQWGGVLRKMRFGPNSTGKLQALLATLYPNPLSFDEWHDLFEQLAIGQALATKYVHLR